MKEKEKLQTISLGDAVSAIEEWDSHNADYKSLTKDIQFAANSTSNTISTDEIDMELDNNAFKQLSNHLQVPGHWSIDEVKCPPDLRETIINHRLQDPKAKWVTREWLIRTRRDHVRAMLSSYYTPFDHLEFIRTIDAVLANMDLSQYAQVARMEVNDRMRMWIVFPGQLPETDGNGFKGYDGLGIGKTYAGIYLSNDETGRGSITVAPGTIRAACANGLIFWKENLRFTRVHISIGTKLHEKVADNITRSLELAQANLNDLVSLKNYVVKRPKSIIDNYARSYRLPQDVRNYWYEWSTKVGENLTMRDLVNMATEISQQQPTELAETMDQMAGAMVMAYANKEQ